MSLRILILLLVVGKTFAAIGDLDEFLGTWENGTFEPEYIITSKGRIHPSRSNLIALQGWLRDHQHNNPLLRPGIHPYHGTDNPVTEIDVELFFQAVGDVDSMDMNFITTVYLTQSWYDRRLRFGWIGRTEPYINVHYANVDWLWKPDTFMKNELEALKHANTRNNIMTRIYSNGTVLFKRKVSMTLSCQMLLQRFPFDSQNCGTRISSFSYPNTHTKYHWYRKLTQPVTYSKHINLPEYSITGVSFRDCEDVRFNLTYSCLDVTMHFERSFSFYLMQDFIPSGLVVVIACLSFWIDPKAVPARITLGLVSVVTIATQRSSLTQTTPRVYYMRAIDYWMAFCMLITMAAMIEFSVVNTLHRQRANRAFYAVPSRKKKPDRALGDVTSSCSDDLSEEGFVQIKDPPLNRWQRLFGKYEDDEAGYVDAVCRAIFPAVFVFFNIIFWVTYKLIYTHHRDFSQPE